MELSTIYDMFNQTREIIDEEIHEVEKKNRLYELFEPETYNNEMLEGYFKIYRVHSDTLAHKLFDNPTFQDIYAVKLALMRLKDEEEEIQKIVNQTLKHIHEIHTLGIDLKPTSMWAMWKPYLEGSYDKHKTKKNL